MRAVKFEQANHNLAENQDEYQTLPIHVPCDESGNITDPNVPCTFCMEFDADELEQIAKTGRAFFTQLTFGQPFQPINMSVLNPFI